MDEHELRSRAAGMMPELLTDLEHLVGIPSVAFPATRLNPSGRWPTRRCGCSGRPASPTRSCRTSPTGGLADRGGPPPPRHRAIGAKGDSLPSACRPSSATCSGSIAPGRRCSSRSTRAAASRPASSDRGRTCDRTSHAASRRRARTGRHGRSPAPGVAPAVRRPRPAGSAPRTGR
jgi:hypothetical protein